MDIEKEILNIEEASKFLKCSPRTLRDFAKEKKVPAFKMGRVWKFRKKDLDSFIDGLSNVGGQDEKQH